MNYYLGWVGIAIVLTLVVLDGNILDLLYLYVYKYPVLLAQKTWIWLRIWPRLQWDTWWLKKGNNRVGKPSQRFVRMAEQVLEELNDRAGRDQKGD